MNHYTWTYVGDVGQSAKVGLLHSSKSGHLMVYCNARIIIVDFKVLNSKTYSFFINDELCELKLERKGNKMFYNFEINKEADTPRNRARKKLERKHWKQTLAFFSLFALVVTFSVLGIQSFMSKSRPDISVILKEGALQSVAQVNINYQKNEPDISYFFVAQNTSYSSKPPFEKVQSQILLSTGLPLESGDEFIVEYAPSNPKVNKIRFEQPTEKQLKVYQQRILEKHASLNPSQEERHIICMMDIAFELKGLNGWADFYFQDVSPQENPSHNQITYQRLTRDLSFQKKLNENCWN